MRIHHRTSPAAQPESAQIHSFGATTREKGYATDPKTPKRDLRNRIARSYDPSLFGDRWYRNGEVHGYYRACFQKNRRTNLLLCQVKVYHGSRLSKAKVTGYAWCQAHRLKLYTGSNLLSAHTDDL